MAMVTGMKILGITGQVGAGKSEVLSWLEKCYKARVIQADRVGHLLMEPGMPCYDKIVSAFGGDILDERGQIDRGRLAGQVFVDRGKLACLNGIIHPAVKAWILEEIRRERAAGEASFVAVEAALLLEEHYDKICDEIWYIYVNDAARRERLFKSRGYTDEKIDSILSNQQPDRVFRERCQFVVDNSKDFVENTLEQIDRGLREHGFLQYCER